MCERPMSRSTSTTLWYAGFHTGFFAWGPRGGGLLVHYQRQVLQFPDEDLAKFARFKAYAYAHAAAHTFQSANLE